MPSATEVIDCTLQQQSMSLGLLLSVNLNHLNPEHFCPLNIIKFKSFKNSFWGKKKYESRTNDKIKKPIVHLDLKIRHEFSKSQTV